MDFMEKGERLLIGGGRPHGREVMGEAGDCIFRSSLLPGWE